MQEGKTAADVQIGRTIQETLTSVPRIQPEIFDKIFNGSIQDLLMVVYLSNLTRAQISIAEKMNSVLYSQK